jgi:hypothetical protein
MVTMLAMILPWAFLTLVACKTRESGDSVDRS